MKTLLLFITAMTSTTVLANPWELRARFSTSPPEGYFIIIQPYDLVTHYDYNCFPKEAGTRFPNPSDEKKPTVTADFNSTDGTDGAIYYGVYAIHFLNSDGITIKRAIIDWRDADYFNAAPLYAASYDFEVIFNLMDSSVTYQRTVTGQSKKFNKQTVTPWYSIYELAEKSQNTSPFKNLQMSTFGAGQNVNFTVGSANYSVPQSGSVYAAVGAGSVQVTVPNQWISIPTVPPTYTYFWYWENGEHFNPTRTVSTSINLSSVKAYFLTTMEQTTISGPTSFNRKMPLTYNALVWYPPSPQQLAYYWYIKYDFNNVWQYAGGLSSKTVVPSAGSGYSFYIKCYVKDNLT